MVSRLFPTSNKIYLSSDYTDYKRQTTVYNSVKTNKLYQNKNYESNFILTKLTIDNSSCVVASNSYKNLLDINKGYNLCNPCNISNNFTDSTIGSLLNVDMSNVAGLRDLSWNSSTLKLESGSLNIMQFPPPSQQSTDLWNTNSYPGFILDPSFQLTWDKCNDNINNYDITSIKNLGSLIDLSSNLYYGFNNTKKLNGFKYPSKINLN